MLNIPESVKTLYKTDGVRKNFRAHFPGGELPDITNRDIVRESLHFTESVCSQSVFRFGLAEASVLEFETVGISNLLGLTIEASIEISTTSLSAAEISAIQAGSWDGVLVLAADSDLGYGFYRIPLGTFRVDACPRNHGAMTHRRVTAYSTGLLDSSITPAVERWKMITPWRESSQRYDMATLLDAAVYADNAEQIGQLYTRTAGSTYTAAASPATISIPVPGGVIEVNPQSLNAQTYTGPVWDGTAYAVDRAAYDTTPVVNFVTSTLETLDLAEYAPQVLDAVRPLLDPQLHSVVSASYTDLVRDGFSITRSLPIFAWPKRVQAKITAYTGVNLYLIFRPTSGSVRNFRQQFNFGANLFTPYTLTHNDPQPRSAEVVFTATDGNGASGTAARYTYADAYDIPALLRGWLELSGLFGTEDRGRGFERFALSPANPVEVGPGSYDDAWWDEYDVDRIGTVTVAFKSGDEEATANVYLGGGSSVYDMSDNEALKALDGLTFDAIVELLSGDFAANAQAVGFTPIELTMQGWPWIEAGDALRVTAEDGTVVNTYALRVELSGVQNLSADIVSEGGEIIGEV